METKKIREKFTTTLDKDCKKQLLYIIAVSDKDFKKSNDVIEYLVKKEYERLKK